MKLKKRILALTCLCVLFSCAFALTANAATISAPKIKASNVSSSGKIELEWDAVKGASKYKIYRSADKNGTYRLLKTVDAVEYVNSNAVVGKKYYYYVRAVSKTGKVSSKSNVVERYCDLKRPIISSITNVSSNGKIKLTWDSIEGASAYKVYRATSKNGTYKLMKTTTSTSYTNTASVAGRTYYYKVRAIASKSSANSAYSKVASRTCDLARPVVKVILNSKGMPKLTWKKVEGAIGYEVYRSLSKTSGYELLKYTSKSSLINKTASLDCKYYYKVKAINKNSAANSAFSIVDSIKTNEFEKRYILLPQVYVYAEPSSKSKSTCLPYMEEIDLGKTIHDYSSGKWYKLRYNGNIQYMWVSKGETKFTDTESSYDYKSDNPYAQEIINLAKKICFSWETYYTSDDSTGIPDGQGRYGFDCSGFVTYCINTVMQKYNPAYRLIGYTDKLYGMDIIYNGGYRGEFSAQDVDVSDILPGDLIFLDMSGSGMNHVGMYLGNGEFAHISGTWNRVTIMPIETGFSDKVVSVRRFIPETVKSADKQMYATVGWCNLYAERSDESKILYTFSKNEKLKLLFTNAGGNWAYVTTYDGDKEGFVLTKFLSKTKV